MITYIIFMIIVILIAIIIAAAGNVNKFEQVKKNEPQITKEEYKGRAGEKETALVLSRVNGYKQIINNITFNDNGKTNRPHCDSRIRNICN